MSELNNLNQLKKTDFKMDDFGGEKKKVAVFKLKSLFKISFRTFFTRPSCVFEIQKFKNSFWFVHHYKHLGKNKKATATKRNGWNQ